MNKIFVVDTSDKSFQTVYTRSRAKGYKRLVIGEDVDPEKGLPIELKTNGTDLVISPAEDKKDDNEVYTILCKEFGLVGEAAGIKSKISVMHCDNGWMLVTLLEGAIIINLENQLMMPVVGDAPAPKVVQQDICWVNANDLLDYNKYWGTKGQFYQDVEFVFTVSGDCIGGTRRFSIKHHRDEDIDMSLGFLAQYEQNQQNKKDAKATKELASAILNTDSSSSYEFDDDEDDIYGDEDDTDDYSDYGI